MHPSIAGLSVALGVLSGASAARAGALGPGQAARTRAPAARVADRTPERDSLPDVLVVVLDDVALSDLDLIPTPNIDWIAAQGVSFRRAYSMPVCGPTRYSLMFGEYRVPNNGPHCGPPSATTPSPETYSLSRMMSERGYRTAAFGKWHLGSNRLGPWEYTPAVHGFDTWRALTPSNVNRCGSQSYEDWTRVDDGVVSRSTEYHTAAVRDALLPWWTSTEGPRFAYVAFQTPHEPLHVPPADLLPPHYPAPSTNRELYEAMLVSADLVIGQILEVVDLRTTCVVVLGDNGTAPAAIRPDRRTGRAKYSTFEEGVHVPLIIAGAGTSASFETDALVHAVDLPATLADIVGARPPDHAFRDSVSLVPCLRRPGARVREFAFCNFRRPVAQRDDWDRAIVTQRWKLRRVDLRSGTVESLYDLWLDPRESSPIDPDDPGLGPEPAALVAGMRSLLNEMEQR